MDSIWTYEVSSMSESKFATLKSINVTNILLC